VKQQGRRPVDPFIVYGPLSDSFEFETFLILKSAFPPNQLAAAAAKSIHSVDPNEPVFDVASMDDRLGAALSRPRSIMTLMSLLAGVALVLVTLGIFGMTAYFVNRRRHEIGIRMALGATRARVSRMILGRAMVLVVAGIGLGICCASALLRTLGSFVEGLPNADPATLAAVAVGFSSVAGMACLIPARLAASLDPLVVLRQDS
jgi:ABC-type antimicrobial peptide transport system permease subunit